MAYAEKRTGRGGKPYYRACFQRPDRKAQGVVVDADGKAVRYPTKTTAQKAAEKAEVEAYEEAKKGRWTPPELQVEAGQKTFAQYTETWIEDQDLASSTMQNYRRSLAHLLPAFGTHPIRNTTKEMISKWEREQKASGAMPSSIRTRRSLLHLILADAVDEEYAPKNVAERRRGRGRRQGRSRSRGPEKKITSMLGALLVAERASLLSGRDDEFVASINKAYTGMRWGEIVGLERQFARPEARSIRVEWQLYELDSGHLERCPPKDDSYRTIDTPVWQADLNARFFARTPGAACPCHGLVYAFTGRGMAGQKRGGPTLKQVAQACGVSTGTISNVLNRPDAVAEATRAKVELAIAELGYERPAGTDREAAHWRRSGHATWIFTPAASGWYPKKAPQDAHPVPVTAEPWPGVPVRGRGAAARAEACWLPIRSGLTRHSLRHGNRTLLEELGTPKVLIDDRLGHEDGSISARYTHITDSMRAALMEQLTVIWFAALDERLAMAPRSAVRILDELLQQRAAEPDAPSKITPS
ncbi:LacI family DNA-binding transcriptional regulator [Streptomyces scabiei]|uniref:LacI family DNA-binding transcriptional regulator n=1 Tax=Streptomyces scabiei TaxID=1930 RepID=UPI0029B37505|nr:LacI family DNA-binding transcriptional regulator [Streptomyces scabiei]MDX3162379.1 LacI family DNA-binding transcriptional regulator [Streptomyces scabiei]